MDETMEYYQTVSGNEMPVEEADPGNGELLGEILETLTGTQSYGTIGDYYFQALGCYVFPSFDVYEYFIDIDAVGQEWAEASDGHYLLKLYLEKYEEYIAGAEESEEMEESGSPEELMPDETELQNLETLESVRGLLSVIKENNAAFYDEVLEYQTEMIALEERSVAYAEGTLYADITACILLAIIAGTFISHVFFGRMRAG